MTDEEINGVVGQLYDFLLPQAEIMSERLGRSVHSCMRTLAGKEFEYYIAGARPAEEDGREVMWTINVSFWRKYADGNHDKVGEALGEQARGFSGVIDAVVDFATAMHGEEVLKEHPFHPINLKKRFAGMRPAISRGGGMASTGLHYIVDKVPYQCIVEVVRPETT